MEERIDIVDFQKEEKSHKRKEKIQSTLSSIGQQIERNKVMDYFLSPAALGMTTAGKKAVSKHASQGQEKKSYLYICYDSVLGRILLVNRELTKSEWRKIERRKNNGERLVDILEELKVLKSVW